MNSEKNTYQRSALCVVAFLALSIVAAAQTAVNVTVVADDTSLIVGQTTMVTVYGEIDALIEDEVSQIFSWYIDVLNSDGSVAEGYAAFQTPTSDNEPGDASSDGVAEASNLHGIYDSFTSVSALGAGKGSSVVLAQFEALALTPGTTTFSAVAGSTGEELFDFLVPKIGSLEDPFTGGNYSAASVAITVTSGEADLSGLDLEVEVVGTQAMVTFNPVSGYDHVVQWSSTLLPLSWAPLAAGPHNTGSVNTDLVGFPERFYRVVLTAQ